MKRPGFVARWRTFLKVLSADPQPFTHRHDPALQRRLQRTAAREAVLSTQLPGQRQLAGPNFGDTQ